MLPDPGEGAMHEVVIGRELIEALGVGLVHVMEQVDIARAAVGRGIFAVAQQEIGARIGGHRHEAVKHHGVAGGPHADHQARARKDGQRPAPVEKAEHQRDGQHHEQREAEGGHGEDQRAEGESRGQLDQKAAPALHQLRHGGDKKKLSQGLRIERARGVKEDRIENDHAGRDQQKSGALGRPADAADKKDGPAIRR